jgi:DNA polymerase-1
MLLLLDTDIFAYQATTSAETEIDMGGDIWSLTMDMQQARDTFEAAVDRIKQRLETNDVLCCMSDHAGNFRKQVWPDYKSNRRKSRKPVGYVAFCDWVRETYATASRPMLEADDVMGIVSTKNGNQGKVTIVSDDKDMKTIPGRLYRPMADELLEITEEEADRFFFTQVLTGDTADGYKGVPGIGPKKAEAILGPRPHWGAVEKAYIDAGLTRDDAIQQARLARILRWSDWSEGGPKLWTP